MSKVSKNFSGMRSSLGGGPTAQGGRLNKMKLKDEKAAIMNLTMRASNMQIEKQQQASGGGKLGQQKKIKIKDNTINGELGINTSTVFQGMAPINSTLQNLQNAHQIYTVTSPT